MFSTIFSRRAVGVAVAFTLGLGCLATRAHGVTLGSHDWHELGRVPGAAHRDPPQGMTLVGDQLVVSDHVHDTRSRLFRYRLGSSVPTASAEMPPEASHTGGLAWDGSWLWAADYNANRLYRIDYERTFAEHRAVVVDSYSTGLSGTSAVAFLALDGVGYLVVSDYGWLPTSRTYVVRVDRLSANEHQPLPAIADLAYENGGFSQGLAWDGELLYEAVNGAAHDQVWVLDIKDALRTHDARRVVRCGALVGPGGGIEDLATDGTSLWTSDESSFRFYRRDDLAEVRARFGRNPRQMTNQSFLGSITARQMSVRSSMPNTQPSSFSMSPE